MAGCDVPPIGPMTLDELKELSTFQGVSPSQIFGVEIPEKGFNLEAQKPPLKAFFIIGKALSGAALDSWARHGMHNCRKDEFSNFDRFSKDSSAEEKLCLVRILQIFEHDIRQCSQSGLGGETLASVAMWVNHMLKTLDDETMSGAIKAGLLEELPIEMPSALSDMPESKAVTLSQAGLRALMQKVFGHLLRLLK